MQCGRGERSAPSLQRCTQASPNADRNSIAGVVCGIVLQRGSGVLCRAVNATASAAVSWGHALIGVGIGGRPCCSEDCIASSFRLMSKQCCMMCQKSLPCCTQQCGRHRAVHASAQQMSTSEASVPGEADSCSMQQLCLPLRSTVALLTGPTVTLMVCRRTH